jgi:hypothetical protein
MTPKPIDSAGASATSYPTAPEPSATSNVNSHGRNSDIEAIDTGRQSSTMPQPAEHSTAPPELPFLPLTPNLESKQTDLYLRALDWALDRDEIRNIALTGPYGAGKSSILHSYVSHNTKRKFLHISLATFANTNSDKGHGGPNNSESAFAPDPANATGKSDKPDTGDDLTAVQLSILQQILYKVPHSAIPDSRFTRIYGITNRQLLQFVIGFILWLLSLAEIRGVVLFKTPHWVLKNTPFLLDIVYWLSVPAALAGSVISLFFAVRWLKKLNVQKVKLGGGSLEMEGKQETSILNKHFDEMLYFFETTAYDTLIIEDLDRFENTDIFAKLRELNGLLNNSEQIRKRKKVVFIYAIKDDLFTKGDRTKFFDFILPVIPVVNHSNAGERLYDLLDNAQQTANLDRSFVNTIGYFIDDMRMVRNIFNEYFIYNDKIKFGEPKKLLAAVAYKNLYPEDFSRLHLREGMLFSVFAKKKQVIADRRSQLESQIADFERQIEVSQREFTQTIHELQLLYLTRIVGKLRPFSGIFSSRGPITLWEYIAEGNFEGLIKKEKLDYYTSGPYDNYKTYDNFSWNAVQAEVNPSTTYEQRLTAIKNKETENRNAILSELKRLHREKAINSNTTVAQLLSAGLPIAKFGEALNGEPLLAYFLRTGAIDEMYQTYMSYFYEGSLTTADKEFIMAVKTKTGKPGDFSLTMIDKIIDELSSGDFIQPEVLNFTLIDHLIRKRMQYSEQLNLILGQLDDNRTPFLQFLIDYSPNGTEARGFFNQLFTQKPEAWAIISEGPGLNDASKGHLLLQLIDSNPLSALEKYDNENNNSIATFLANRDDLLAEVDAGADQDKLASLIINLSVRLKTIRFYPTVDELFNKLYTHNSYRLTPENIKTILAHNNQPVDEKPATLSAIRQTPLTDLISYIDTELNTYIKEVFLPSPVDVSETTDTFLYLLNNDHLDSELKEEIITERSFALPDLEQVKSPDLWPEIAMKNRMAATWSNIRKYFLKSGAIDDSLQYFLEIEKNTNDLSAAFLIPDWEEPNNLYWAILLSNKIRFAAYIQLLKSLANQPLFFSQLTLEPRRVHELIQKDIFAFSRANFNLLTEEYISQRLEYIIHYVKEILDNPSELVLSEDDWIAALKTSRISPPRRLSLSNLIPPAIVDSSPNLSIDLTNFWLRHKHFGPVNVWKKLFDTAPDLDTRIELLTIRNGTPQADELSDLLSQMGGYYPSLLDPQVTSYQSGDVEQSTLSMLRKWGYIENFKTSESEITITRSPST